MAPGRKIKKAVHGGSVRSSARLQALQQARAGGGAGGAVVPQRGHIRPAPTSSTIEERCLVILNWQLKKHEKIVAIAMTEEGPILLTSHKRLFYMRKDWAGIRKARRFTREGDLEKDRYVSGSGRIVEGQLWWFEHEQRLVVSFDNTFHVVKVNFTGEAVVTRLPLDPGNTICDATLAFKELNKRFEFDSILFVGAGNDEVYVKTLKMTGDFYFDKIEKVHDRYTLKSSMGRVRSFLRVKYGHVFSTSRGVYTNLFPADGGDENEVDTQNLLPHSETARVCGHPRGQAPPLLARINETKVVVAYDDEILIVDPRLHQHASPVARFAWNRTRPFAIYRIYHKIVCVGEGYIALLSDSADALGLRGDYFASCADEDRVYVITRSLAGSWDMTYFLFGTEEAKRAKMRMPLQKEGKIVCRGCRHVILAGRVDNRMAGTYHKDECPREKTPDPFSEEENENDVDYKYLDN